MKRSCMAQWVAFILTGEKMDVQALDQEEYFHLISHALVKGNWSKAEEIAHEAIQHFENAEFYYLYGSISAHQKDFGRAVEWLERALAFKQGLTSKYPAVFQLGLIHLTAGRVSEAKSAWEQLSDLTEEHYFRRFSDGMLALADNRFDYAQQCLEAGIERNHEFPSINQDMMYALNQIKQVSGKQAEVKQHYDQDGSVNG